MKRPDPPKRVGPPLRRRAAGDRRLPQYVAVRLAEAGRLRRHAATLPRTPSGAGYPRRRG